MVSHVTHTLLFYVPSEGLTIHTEKINHKQKVEVDFLLHFFVQEKWDPLKGFTFQINTKRVLKGLTNTKGTHCTRNPCEPRFDARMTHSIFGKSARRRLPPEILKPSAPTTTHALCPGQTRQHRSDAGLTCSVFGQPTQRRLPRGS